MARQAWIPQGAVQTSCFQKAILSGCAAGTGFKGHQRSRSDPSPRPHPAHPRAASSRPETTEWHWRAGTARERGTCVSGGGAEKDWKCLDWPAPHSKSPASAHTGDFLKEDAQRGEVLGSFRDQRPPCQCFVETGRSSVLGDSEPQRADRRGRSLMRAGGGEARKWQGAWLSVERRSRCLPGRPSLSSMAGHSEQEGQGRDVPSLRCAAQPEKIQVGLPFAAEWGLPGSACLCFTPDVSLGRCLSHG